MPRILANCCSFLFALSISAQADTVTSGTLFEPYTGGTTTQVDTPTTSNRGPGTVKVVADPKVEDLMRKYSAHKHLQHGYRVQIFLGDHRTAEETKRAFLQKNPETPVYLSWLAPNFRLRAGDLRTRLEAERLLRDLRVVYPGSYIVPDDIEMPVVVR